MISLLPGDESIRERFKKASMDLDDLTYSELKKEVENFASSALDIKELNPFSFKENMLIGIKLMRSALNICSLVNDTHLVASSAYLILSIGVTAFNMNVESNIDFVVQEILDKQQDDDLTNACKNAQVDFGNASNFLCGIGFRKIVDHDISSLESHVPIDAGVDLLGNLVLIIQDRQNKTEGEFIIRPLAYPTKRLYMADVFGKWIRISEHLRQNSHSIQDYITFTISSIKWPEYFIRMEMGVWVAGKKGCPDGQADFKIVQIDEVNQGEPCYLLAPTVMKTKLLYAASKVRVCGESCIPNTNHFWMIEKC